MPMKRQLGSLAATGGMVLLGLLAAAPASATSIQLPLVHQVTQVSVLKPNGVAYDGYNDEVYVTSVGPPPRVYLYDGNDFVAKGAIDLPSDAEPGAIAFGPDGYLYVVDHAKDRIFRICPDCGDVTEITFPSSVQFITDYIDGYRSGPTLLDFGDSFSAGFLWFGGGFSMKVPMPDTITPNGGDILNDTAKPRQGRIQDEILMADAENNQIVRIGDTPTPAFLGTIHGLPGNPGLQPPRDLDVNPLNLNPSVSGPAIHPIFVAFPDLGILESLGPNGPWIQIQASGIGRPTQVSSDCTTIGATSFSQNLVTFFKQDEPKGSHCEDFVELLVKSLGGTTDAPVMGGSVKSYVDGKALIGVGYAEEHGRTAFSAKARMTKAKLTAGKLSKFKLRLPSAVGGELRRKHRAVVKVRIKIKAPTGQTTKVVRRVRIKT